ncbi:MAG: endonuclease III domain-containing protein [Candidatus Omnitrophica bacterium]|nr:endonuclease III domain-containing protein [Candidatus Omnitrophota bacterium]
MQIQRRRCGILRVAYNKLYEFYGPQHWWPGRSRFEVIIGAILTQNTAWRNVEKAIKNLRAAGCLSSPSKFHNITAKRLSRLIRPAGYYNVKAKRLKNFTGYLVKRYGGSLDKLARVETGRLRRELLEVNGIGPETRDSILLYAFMRPVFVVDAYTKRIFSRHGLVTRGASYESVQALFTKNLPPEVNIFNEYHALIVRLGKDHCRKRPRCEECPLKSVKLLAKHLW